MGVNIESNFFLNWILYNCVLEIDGQCNLHRWCHHGPPGSASPVLGISWDPLSNGFFFKVVKWWKEMNENRHPMVPYKTILFVWWEADCILVYSEDQTSPGNSRPFHTNSMGISHAYKIPENLLHKKVPSSESHGCLTFLECRWHSCSPLLVDVLGDKRLL